MNNIVSLSKYRGSTKRNKTIKNEIISFLEKNNLDYAIVVNNYTANQLMKDKQVPKDLKYLVMADNNDYNIRSTNANKVYYMDLSKKK